MSNEQPPEVSSKTSVLNEPELADALRMVRAIKVFAKGYQKNEHIQKQVVAACIMLKRVETLNQLHYVCAQLRDLLAMFNEREMDYERVLFDLAQGERRTGVRYSDTVRDRGRDLDNSDVGPPSVPIPDVEAGRSDGHFGHIEERRRYLSGGVRQAPDRLAGSLPKRKGRKSRAKPKRIVPSSHVYVAQVPKKGLDE